MIGPVIAALRSLSPELSVHEALSGIFGSISLVTWIFVLVPQLVLNYKTGKAEGLSLSFLIVWLFGDITNLTGALWAHLVPTVIVLACYFCLADVVLIIQFLYYDKWLRRHLDDSTRGRVSTPTSSDPSEESPLLSSSPSRSLTRRDTRSSSRGKRTTSKVPSGLPGSLRRLSSVEPPNHNSLTKDWEASTDEDDSWKRNVLSILAIIIMGVAGWAFAWRSGAWKPVADPGNVVDQTEVPLGAELLGYISASAYLIARTPQIYKNWKEQSCEGLALLFFLLSLIGNLTYGLSILCHSLKWDYVLTNLPWLIGSLGTIVEDVIIAVQFKMYNNSKLNHSAMV